MSTPQSDPIAVSSHPNRFASKTIVITGAGGTFGRSGCLYFALHGANVVALDKSSEALGTAVDFVRASLPSAHAERVRGVECDVTQQDSVKYAVRDAIAQFGRIDLLWNNAGYQGEIKHTLEYPVPDFAEVMSINVTGMFIVMQAVAQQMVSQDGDAPRTPNKYAIVNTASVAGMRGTPAMVAYSASKAAVLAMTVSSAKDLAPHGIRVNAVSPALIGPGIMWTRQNEGHATSGSPYFSSDPSAVAEGKVSSVPMKRLGTTEEVVNSVAFLLSDEASYTTAFNLVVDGGMSGGLH